jgi:hypothetical protein
MDIWWMGRRKEAGGDDDSSTSSQRIDTDEEEDGEKQERGSQAGAPGSIWPASSAKPIRSRLKRCYSRSCSSYSYVYSGLMSMEENI